MLIDGEIGLGIRECVQEIAATGKQSLNLCHPELELTGMLEDSVQALYDETTDTLFQHHSLQPQDKSRLLNAAIDLLRKQLAHLQLIPLPRIRPLLNDLRTSDDDSYRKVANSFLGQLTDRSVKGHKDWASSEAPEGKSIINSLFWPRHANSERFYQAKLLRACTTSFWSLSRAGRTFN